MMTACESKGQSTAKQQSSNRASNGASSRASCGYLAGSELDRAPEALRVDDQRQPLPVRLRVVRRRAVDRGDRNSDRVAGVTVDDNRLRAGVVGAAHGSALLKHRQSAGGAKERAACGRQAPRRGTQSDSRLA